MIKDILIFLFRVVLWAGGIMALLGFIIYMVEFCVFSFKHPDEPMGIHPWWFWW